MAPVKEVVLPDGTRRYRFVLDVGLDGRRKQITRTYDTLAEAQERHAEHVAARQARRQPAGQFQVTDLFADGRCHPMCVFAWGSEEEDCRCACGGQFHGKLLELRTEWAQFEQMGKPKQQRKNSARITPEMRRRVLYLHSEAMASATYRFRPATYIRERLAAEGVAFKQWQVNSWLQVARRNGAPPGLS